jgi:hypothetical protein
VVLNTTPDVSDSTSPVSRPTAVPEGAKRLITRGNFLIDKRFPQRDDSVTVPNQGQNKRYAS